ncbi:MAG: hypothetical protein HYW47_06735 [Deltaproteobacteria bacterium]|nr:hypothetical protein [Deltaproteobacteria bacterium]
MKKVLFFLFFIVIPSLSMTEGGFGTVKVACVDIEAASYSGNASNGTFQAMLRFKNGRTFYKNFMAPNGLENTSQFLKDLKNCDSLDLFYTRNSSSNMLMVTTFAVNFKFE